MARKSGTSMAGKDHLLPSDLFIDSYMPIGYGFIFPGKSTRHVRYTEKVICGTLRSQSRLHLPTSLEMEMSERGA